MIKLINYIRILGHPKNISSIKTPLIIDALQYVNENFKEKMTATDTATHFYVNTSYLSRVFSKYLNITLLKYIEKVKIYDLACDIIKYKSDYDL